MILAAKNGHSGRYENRKQHGGGIFGRAMPQRTAGEGTGKPVAP
jgi:hypothetical protein